MKGVALKVFGAILLALGINAALAWVQVLLSLPQGIQPQFLGQWQYFRACFLFIEGIPVAVLAAILFSWAYLIDSGTVRRNTGRDNAFWPLVRGQITGALVCGALYIMAIAFWQGDCLRQTIQAESNSRVLQGLYQDFDQAVEAKDANSAILTIRKARAMAPDQADTRTRHQLLAGKLETWADSRIADGIKASASSEAAIAKFRFADMLAEARKHYEAKDLYSALYYAEMAVQAASAASRPEAEVLISDIRRSLGVLEGQAGDLQQRRINEIKERAIIRELRGKSDYIAAYYSLKELEALAPNDRDLAIWLPIVSKNMEGVAFFQEDLEEAMVHPSTGSLFIRTSDSEGNGRFLYADQVLQGRFAWFLTGFEVLDLDAAGNVVRHLQAPGAKIIPAPGPDPKPGQPKAAASWLILARSVLREKPGIHTAATDLLEPAAIQIEHAIPAPGSGSELFTLAQAGARYEAVSFADLLWFRDILGKYAWDVRPVQVEILDRIIQGASLIVFWLAGMVVAWSLRSRYAQRPRFLGALMVLVLPLVSFVLVRATIFLCHQIATSVLLLWGEYAAWVAIAVILGGGLTSALIASAALRVE